MYNLWINILTKLWFLWSLSEHLASEQGNIPQLKMLPCFVYMPELLTSTAPVFIYMQACVIVNVIVCRAHLNAHLVPGDVTLPTARFK
jgi:hypothetical protein